MALEIPDEYGLSSDSLRGSHQFIQPHLVDADDSRDPLTGRPNPRAPLSRNEIRALEDKGMLVDENGYEREPEPVVVAAPVPMAQPRVRKQDRAPAGETHPTPHLQIPVESSSGAVRPSGSSPHPLTQQEHEQPSQGVVRPDGEPYGSVTPIPPYAGGLPPTTTPPPNPPTYAPSELD